MKDFRVKYVLGGLASVLVIAVLAVIIRNMAFPACPITNNMTLKELSKLDIRVAYIEDSKSWTDEVYDSFCENELSGAKECSNILVGRPTGNIYFNRGTILQEVFVRKVIKGSCKYEKIWLQNGLQSTLEYDSDKVILSGMDRSFMQEDCDYLLFCSSSAVNKYSDKKVYTEASGMWFGCYNITRDSEIVMEANENKYNSQIEFYTSSKRTMQCYNKTKGKLLEIYCK